MSQQGDSSTPDSTKDDEMYESGSGDTHSSDEDIERIVRKPGTLSLVQTGSKPTSGPYGTGVMHRFERRNSAGDLIEQSKDFVFSRNSVSKIDLESIELASYGLNEPGFEWFFRRMVGLHEVRRHYKFTGFSQQNPRYAEELMTAVISDIVAVLELDIPSGLDVSETLKLLSTNQLVNRWLLGILEAARSRLSERVGKFGTFFSKLFSIFKIARYDLNSLKEFSECFSGGTVSLWCEDFCMNFTRDDCKMLVNYLKQEQEKSVEPVASLLNKICHRLRDKQNKTDIPESIFENRVRILPVNLRPMRKLHGVKKQLPSILRTMAQLDLRNVISILMPLISGDVFSQNSYRMVLGGAMYALTFLWPIRSESVAQIRVADVWNLLHVTKPEYLYPLKIADTKSARVDMNGNKLGSAVLKFHAVPAEIVLLLQIVFYMRQLVHEDCPIEDGDEFLFLSEAGQKVTNVREYRKFFVKSATNNDKEVLAQVKNKNGRSLYSSLVAMIQKNVSWEHTMKTVESNYNIDAVKFFNNCQLRGAVAKCLKSMFPDSLPTFLDVLEKKYHDCGIFFREIASTWISVEESKHDDKCLYGLLIYFSERNRL